MRISYDSEVDALYIRLLEGEYQCRTLRWTEEISLNLGPGEGLVGIEVLDAASDEWGLTSQKVRNNEPLPRPPD